MNYPGRFAQPEVACWLRQTDDPIVMLGPLFQPIRGVIFALAFYPLRATLFGKKNGWLVMWWVLVALGIINTFGPAPGSIEGLVYTTLSIGGQISGWFEIITQALAFSILLFYWVNHPHKKWLNWILGLALFVIILLTTLGLLFTLGYMQLKSPKPIYAVL